MNISTIATRKANPNTHFPLRLDANRVDIWRCSPYALSRGQLHTCLSTLNRVERRRYRLMRSTDARLHFVVGRSLTRHVLSRYALTPPNALRFTVNEHGRPSVDWPRSNRNIHFSLSHTPGLIALAVSSIPEIGIDVENVDRQVEISEIAEAVFTQCELDEILRAAPDNERVNFFELWTLKEAYIKARGRGFSLPPRTFAFSNLNDPISLRLAPDCDRSPGRWRFGISRYRSGFRMAIAVGSRSATRMRQLDWDPPAKIILNADEHHF